MTLPLRCTADCCRTKRIFRQLANRTSTALAWSIRTLVCKARITLRTMVQIRVAKSATLAISRLSRLKRRVVVTDYGLCLGDATENDSKAYATYTPCASIDFKIGANAATACKAEGGVSRRPVLCGLERLHGRRGVHGLSVDLY